MLQFTISALALLKAVSGAHDPDADVIRFVFVLGVGMLMIGWTVGYLVGHKRGPLLGGVQGLGAVGLIALIAFPTISTVLILIPTALVVFMVGSLIHFLAGLFKRRSHSVRRHVDDRTRQV